MDDEVVAVSGFGRCGSSLVMRMLEAGGVPPYRSRFPDYETIEVPRLPDDASWLPDAAGLAVKFLDPLRFSPPAGPRYAVVWLDRDPREQARSMVKFIGARGHRALAGRVDESRIVHSLRRDRGRARRFWEARGARMATFSFEGFLARPLEEAGRLGEFLGRPFDAGRAATQVIERVPGCLAGFLELGLLDAPPVGSDGGDPPPCPGSAEATSGLSCHRREAL